jgi:TRAP-type uncharacterized transport system substrate-binding protein
MFATDVAVLNPSDEERQILEENDVALVEVSADAFETDVHVDTALLVPFYYGFHVGLNVPEDDVYRMLTLIEEHSEELVAADPGLNQINDDLVGMQQRGIRATGDSARIHPGLARFLRERDAWDDSWEIAE